MNQKILMKSVFLYAFLLTAAVPLFFVQETLSPAQKIDTDVALTTELDTVNNYNA